MRLINVHLNLNLALVIINNNHIVLLEIQVVYMIETYYGKIKKNKRLNKKDKRKRKKLLINAHLGQILKIVTAVIVYCKKARFKRMKI